MQRAPRARTGKCVWYLGDAKAILSRRLLRDLVDILTDELGPLAEPLENECLDLSHACGIELIATDDPEAEPIERLLNNLKLGHPGTSIAKFSVSEIPETSSPLDVVT